jgi:hypothetical protein
MIELADERTWPLGVRSRLENARDRLVAYEVERRRIDALIDSDDIRWRLSPPENEHQPVRDALVQEANALIAGERILAWHCTRLLPEEQARVISIGLRRHSRALFETRVADAVAAEVLAPNAAKVLLEDGQIGDPGRDNLLHVILDVETLRDEGAVGDLLRHWGGEAIYNNAGRSRMGAGTVLTSVGEPVIVEVCFPVASLADPFVSIGERLANRFLDRLGVSTADGWRCDGKLRRDLSGAEIVRLIVPSDPYFEALTRQSTWDHPLV